MDTKYVDGRTSLTEILLYLYALLAPMEDVLQGRNGTIVKYVAIAVIVVSLFENSSRIGSWFLSRENKILFYFLFLTMIGVIWAIDFSFAVSCLKTDILLIGVTIFGAISIRSDRQIRRLENAIIFGAIITVVYIMATHNISQIMQLESISAETYRIATSDISDANGSAARLLLAFAILIWRFVDRSENVPRFRFLYIVCSGLIAFFMLLSGSRTALLAILVILMVYAFWGSSEKKIRNIIILIVLACTVYFLMSKYMSSKLFERLLGQGQYTISDSNSRTNIWLNAIKYVVPTMMPWGFGTGNSPAAMSSVAGYYQGVHNTYISMFLEFGILGLPVFLSFLIRMLKRFFQSRETVGMAALSGMMVVMMFLDTYKTKYMWLVIMYCVILIQRQNFNDQQEETYRNRGATRWDG